MHIIRALALATLATENMNVDVMVGSTVAPAGGVTVMSPTLSTSTMSVRVRLTLSRSVNSTVTLNN